MLRTNRKRILWIKIDPLHPLDSGGTIRTYNMLKEWHKHHDITYISLIKRNTPHRYKELAKEYSSHQVWCERADKENNIVTYGLDLLKNLFFSSLPYIIFKYNNWHFQERIKQEIESKKFDLIIIDFLQVSSNFINLNFDARNVVIFEHNVESLIWKRRADESKNLLLKYYMELQWLRCKEYEKYVCQKLAGVIAVSEDDANYFKSGLGLDNVLGYVQTGVDIKFFCPVKRSPLSNNIVFLGSMDWMPNITGIIEFVETTLPLIRKKIPDITLTIVGRNPSDRIKKMGQESYIEVTGTVDDVRPYLNRACLSIVPLTVGGGTRIKIYELMAAKVPVISTLIGAEGLPVTHNENILIADDSESFAQEVIRLIGDVEFQEKISINAFEMVANNFTWEKIVEEFDQLCDI